MEIKEAISLSINGERQDDLIPDLIRIEVEEDVDAASVFRIELALSVERDGSWRYLDEKDLFKVWNRVSIEAGYPESGVETLIDGYITHINVNLSGDAEESTLEISGMDASALMALEEKQLTWSNKKDSEIAQQIFGDYGLSYEVEDTVVRPQETLSATLQSESDIRFLRRLAARNGFECVIQGSKGYFRSPTLELPPQKILAIQFGEETNLVNLHFRVDGTAPSHLEIRRIDPFEKEEVTEERSASPRRKLGETGLADLQSGARDGRLLLKNQIAASSQEMQGRLREGYRGGDRFVHVEGEIDARVYGAVLRSKRLVTIKGAGEQFSGLYYVTRVRHHFDLDGYTQRFEGARNGVGLTGDERFAAAALPIAIAVPGLGGASVESGNRVLPAQQEGSTIPGI
ncbi:MAG: contractile injection system protein, VgrG/Pvc8 family [Candidatus Manganitrophus sp.]|nr:contractile injection system protein, VgrG/Pvc8 family [Candidatus Manganitrophus sp.]